MSNLIKIKRGLEANRTSTTPAEGELLYTTDEKKLWVGDGVTNGGIAVGGGDIANNLFAVTSSVDFTTASGQAVGSLPADADVLRTSLIVETPSDVGTTVTVGDATNGNASYMQASDNDPEVAGRYIADTFVSNGAGIRSILATVVTAGTTGSGTCVVEYRLT